MAITPTFRKEETMENNNNILEEFNVNELEDRVEFGLCGGSGGGGTGGPGPDCPTCEKAN
jgi:hypothetical protein